MSSYKVEELNTYLHKLLAEGKIIHSKSPPATPIFFVPKANRTLPVCLDYRQLNKLTLLNKYQLPLRTEIQGRVACATIFINLNLKDSYHLL